MSTLGDVPVIRTFLSAVAAGRVADAVACFTNDGVFQEPGADPKVGAEALARTFTPFAAAETIWQCLIDDVVDAGPDRLILLYRYVVGDRDDGAVERNGCAVVRLRNGRILEWREYHG